MSFENSVSFSEDPLLVLLKQKLNVDASGQDPKTGIVTLTVTEAQELIKQLESADKKIEWLIRKKKTIADLAKAYHQWTRTKFDLHDARLKNVEEILEESNTVYESLVEDTPFNRGYRAALYWFRNEIQHDPGFVKEVKPTNGANS